MSILFTCVISLFFNFFLFWNQSVGEKWGKIGWWSNLAERDPVVLIVSNGTTAAAQRKRRGQPLAQLTDGRNDVTLNIQGKTTKKRRRKHDQFNIFNWLEREGWVLQHPRWAAKDDSFNIYYSTLKGRIPTDRPDSLKGVSGAEPPSLQIMTSSMHFCWRS